MDNRLKGIFALLTSMVWLLPNGGALWCQSATFTNPSACNLRQPIKDYACSDDGAFGSPDQFGILVANAPVGVLGEEVFLSEVRLLIRHPWTGDLDIALISPSGRRVLLTADNGGGDDNYGLPDSTACSGYVTFAANSCLPIEEGDAPFREGPYQPMESLLSFNDFTTPANGTWILEICDDAPEDVGTLEYVELVFEPVSCLPVFDPEVVRVDTTTVELSWQSAGSCGITIVEYGPPGFVPGIDSLAGGGTVAFAACPPFLLGGLAEEAAYDIYFRKYCPSSQNFSANTCAISAQTGCRPPAPTIVENFDGETTCAPVCDATCPLQGFWRNDARDQSDWLAFREPTPTFGTGPQADVSGNGIYLYLEATESGDCRPGDTAYLLSNCVRFDKKGTDTCHLSLDYHMQGTGVGALRLEASVDGGFNWISLWEKTGDQGPDWQKEYISLADLPDGAVVQFRIAGVRGDGAKGDIAVDEIVFYGAEDQGRPASTFYADADRDGYGDSSLFVESCLEQPPAGFVALAGDCDDGNPDVHPGAPEVPCDGVDNNCNGAADDLVLPAPEAVHDTVCSGEVPQICAIPRSDKLIFWYGSPDGQDFLGIVGECYAPILPENNSPDPVVYRFYAEETDFVCRSGQRTEVVVVVQPNPSLSTTEEPALCPGQTFDLASIEIQDANFVGGTTTYHTDLPATEANALPGSVVQPAEASAYYIKVTSSAGCADVLPVSIDTKSGPALAFTPADSFGLCRESVQALAVQASGGAGSYQYRWSTGASTAGIDVEAPFQNGRTDSYQVTVTDGEGCSTVDTAKVTTTVSIEAVRRTIEEVSSCTGADGSITLEPLDGLAPFSFSWEGANGVRGDTSGIQEELRIADLPQGAYRITITDASAEACSFLMRSVLVNGPNAVIRDPDISPVTCAGAANGQVCLNVEGGNPSFLWSTGDTTRCLQNVGGGTYSVTVTEGDCENVLSGIVVDEPAPVRFDAVAQMPSCSDGADGSLEVEAFGGSGVYSFEWAGGVTGSVRSGLPAGAYPLTVTDGNGCSFADTLLLTAPAPLTVALEEELPVSCSGAADGRLKVASEGGTAPYSYQWNTGNTTPLLTQLGPGNYTVTVTDFHGCSTAETFRLPAPPPLQVAFAGQAAPVCVGDFTGEIQVEVSGGTPGYTFRWSDGNRDSVRTDLGVGTYALVVEDARGCISDTLSVELDPQSTLDWNINVEAPLCEGATDGTIQLQPNGVAPFSYQWEDSSVAEELTGIGTGSYRVTVQDGRGCLYDTTVVVEAPQVFDIDFNVLAPSCNGSEDGVINPVILSGGTPPLSYTWNNGNSTSALFGVGAGEYAVTITGSRSCQYVSDTIIVEDPPPLRYQVASLGTISCKGDSTGFIELAVEGGVEPYAFNWIDEEATGNAAFNLPAGQYQVQILDANNCPIDASVTISEPPALQASVQVETSDLCTGGGPGRAAVLVSGGITPYAYRWSNGSEEPLLTEVEPGDYSLTVEDANACEEVVQAVKIRESVAPLRLDTFFVEDVSCNGARDGQMTATVSGGDPPYRFHFSNNQIVVTNSNSVSRTDLPKNSGYNVTVTDLSTGCVVVSDRLPLAEPPVLSTKVDSIDQIDCFDGIDGAIYASTIGGVAPYSYQWVDQEENLIGTGEDLLQVGAGTYTGLVIDGEGCRDTLPAVDLQPQYPPLKRLDSLTVVTNASCKGGRNGAVDITIAGGLPPYDFKWSNGAATEDLGDLAAGAYSLTLTDDNDCRAILAPIVVAEPDTAIMVAGTGINASCYRMKDGAVRAQLRGGIPPYDLAWTYDGDTIAQNILALDSLRAGNYLLQVRDKAGCERTFPFSVDEPDSLEVQIALYPPDGVGPGEARAIVSGGTPVYRYLWNTGARTPGIDTLLQSDYAVTVTDQNGCNATDSAFLTSVFKHPEVQQARLFPNPSSGIVRLDLTLRRPQDLLLLLIDPSGRPVYRRQLEKAERETLEMDWTGLSPGGYRLVIYAGGRVVYSGKILLL